jgi:cysteine synthase
MESRTTKYTGLLQTIGNTPMIKLQNTTSNKKVSIFVKLEGENPSGSIKDRAALYMIERAEERGELTKDKIILEATSGNTGIALAMVGAQKGYRVKIVMSEGVSKERRTMVKSYGGELILTDKKKGTRGAIDKVWEYMRRDPDSYWFADQFNNMDNSMAHYSDIAPEILGEVEDIDYLVAGIGTSGTIMGIAHRFRQESPRTKIIGVIPPAGYMIQGLQNPGKDFAGDIYNRDDIDNEVTVSEKEAFSTSRELASSEGIFAGMSSGAAIFAAKTIARQIDSGNIVVVSPDRGEKYLSTQLFD